jgi:hypothetical protein
MPTCAQGAIPVAVPRPWLSTWAPGTAAPARCVCVLCPSCSSGDGSDSKDRAPMSLLLHATEPLKSQRPFHLAGGGGMPRPLPMMTRHRWIRRCGSSRPVACPAHIHFYFLCGPDRIILGGPGKCPLGNEPLGSSLACHLGPL